MEPRISHWQPSTLFSKVFALFAASLLGFTLICIGLFYLHQFSRALDDAYESGSILADVMMPAVSDSVVIGDWDTVQRTLRKVSSGQNFSSAEFIDIQDHRLKVDGESSQKPAPAIITWMVRERLQPINRTITVGGKDYGVLRLNFSEDNIAGDIWEVTRLTLVVALLCLIPGHFLIWFPLRRITADLAATANFAGMLSMHQGSRLNIDTSVAETRALADALNRVAQELSEQQQAVLARQFALDQHAVVSISDADGRIVYANDKLLKLSGYEHHEVIGQTHRIFNSGKQGIEFFGQMWKTITAGQVWHGTYINRMKSGDEYWVSATIVPVLGEDGNPFQYISIQTDITELKRTEQALADARRREIETGSEIQRSLLLGDLPWGIHGARLATYTEPSQGIDGDFFAITRFRPDCFEVLVGDVMGKGVPAALIGAGVKSSYNKVLAELFSEHAGARTPPAPAEIMNALHQALTPRLIELNSFVTLALYRIDNAAGTLQFVNAGHTPGLLARCGEAYAVDVLKGDNLPVGVMPDEHYGQFEVAIGPDDTLLVFSDGITETANARKELFGIARLKDILQAGCSTGVPPSALLQSIRHQVREFAGSDALLDDQTALVIEVSPRRGKVRGSLRDRVRPSLAILPWRLDRLGTLRSEIARLAYNLGDQEVDALVLACFEAATNILRHAKPYFSDATIACRLQHETDGFAVELIYPGPVFHPPEEPRPDFSGNSDGGFGLYIIQQSIDTVHYRALMPGISAIRLVKRAATAQPALAATA